MAQKGNNSLANLRANRLGTLNNQLLRPQVEGFLINLLPIIKRISKLIIYSTKEVLID